MKTASDNSSETFSLLNPKLSWNTYSTSSVENIPKYEPKNATSTSRSQPVTHSYILRSSPIQTSSSSSTRSTIGSISALFCEHAKPHSSSSENLPSSLSGNPISLRPSSGIESSFTVHLYPISTHLVGDQESVSSLSAINPTHLPYRTLEENSRPPTPGPYRFPLRLDNQIIIHARQDLRYHILPVNRKIKRVLRFSVNRNRELTRLTHTSTEPKFEIAVKFIGNNSSSNSILNSY